MGASLGACVTIIGGACIVVIHVVIVVGAASSGGEHTILSIVARPVVSPTRTHIVVGCVGIGDVVVSVIDASAGRMLAYELNTVRVESDENAARMRQTATVTLIFFLLSLN
jgi:hypothetical protein